MNRSRRSSVWVALNLAGVALYVYFGMRLWVLPGEEGLPGGPGDAFYWIVTQVPVAIFFLVLNSAALIAILRRAYRTRQFSALYVWVAVASVWVFAAAFDHHRVYRVISPEFTSAGGVSAA